MATDRISQLSDVSIYSAIVGKNIIRTIRQALTMAPDHILQVSNVLIYLAVICENIIIMIIQALTTFDKPGTYGEEATLWILLPYVSY